MLRHKTFYCCKYKHFKNISFCYFILTASSRTLFFQIIFEPDQSVGIILAFRFFCPQGDIKVHYIANMPKNCIHNFFTDTATLDNFDTDLPWEIHCFYCCLFSSILGESSFCLQLWNGTKIHPDCDRANPDTLSKISHECVWV